MYRGDNENYSWRQWTTVSAKCHSFQKSIALYQQNQILKQSVQCETRRDHFSKKKDIENWQNNFWHQEQVNKIIQIVSYKWIKVVYEG